jgi:hypothetical protein
MQDIWDHFQKQIGKQIVPSKNQSCYLVLQEWMIVHELKAALDAAPPSDWIQTTNHVGETYWFNKSSGQTSTTSPLSKQIQSLVDHYRKLGGWFWSSFFDCTLFVLRYEL